MDLRSHGVSETKIEAGDTVRAKCGGPVMVADWVADHVDTPFARCIWFDTRGVLHTTAIRTAALKPAPPP